MLSINVLLFTSSNPLPPAPPPQHTQIMYDQLIGMIICFGKPWWFWSPWGQFVKQRPKERILGHRGIHYTPHILSTEAQSTIRAERVLTTPRSEMLGTLTNTWPHLKWWWWKRLTRIDKLWWTLHDTFTYIIFFEPGRKLMESWKTGLRLHSLHTAVRHNANHSGDLGSNSDSAIHSCCDFRHDKVNETQAIRLNK